MAQKQKSSKAGRQRKKAQNTRYINEHRRERNKVIKLTRHLRKFPDDNVALEAAKMASIALGKTFKAPERKVGA